jgi:hypothetical protein
MSIVKWATELAESLGKPEAAKFIYDWAKTSGGKIPNAAETERLSRAVGEGFNAVGYRYSANPAKDEQHLQKMLLDPKRLADENRAFHVDLTPGGPAARARAFNVTGNYDVFEPGYANVRPLALRLENVARGSDEQANATRFLTEALKRNSSGVRYTPTAGELAGPARDVDSLFYTLAKSSGSNYQPSVAMIDPTAVRDLRTAAFTPRTKAALAAAVAAGATPLLQAKEVSTMANPLDEFSPPRYRSAGRRPEANNDRTASANAPLSALRGYAAGTAGLPGDIEGLLRSGLSQVPSQFLNALPALRAFGIGSRADPTPQLPTTEFYNQYLPGAQLNATPTGKAFTGAGNMLGGTGATTIAGLGAKSTAELANLAARIAAESPRAGSRAAQLGVIKMPGGNFLKGSVEDAVRPMKTPLPDVELVRAAGMDPMNPGRAQAEALNTFIDKKIAPYIKNEMATPGDPLRAMAEKYAVDKPAKLAEVQGRIDAFAAKMEQTARERGVPVGDLTSMRQQMIGLEKEKALVEARQALHTYNAEDAFHGDWLPEQVAVARMQAGFPTHGLGVSPVARAWENASDSALNASTASEHTRPLTNSEIRRGLGSTVDNNSWLLKVPPETPVYYPERGLTEDLGFNHLVDELRNAANPESGLPKNLHIDPADLGKLTMPKAVELVADINAWRATQKAEADLLRANNAATQLVKEYPGQGMKWVELKTPEAKLPEGVSVIKYGDLYHVVDDVGTSLSVGATEKEALNLLSRSERETTLADALKYEGDTMAHCVGGYCPDVVEGKSRIYSLRDAKGQPRVTIEVGKHNPNLDFQYAKENLAELYAKYRANRNDYFNSWPDFLKKEAPELLESTESKIVQIKGFRNKKPADEFLPFVQDFVKSGQWSNVKDLENSGLLRIGDKYVDENKYREVAGDLNPDYISNLINNRVKDLSPDDAEIIRRLQEPEPGFAQGGMVSSNHFDPIRIKQIITSLDDDFDPERIQQIVAQRESAYA